MLEVQSLTKRYGDRVAVDNISFQVGRGEVLGFLGPNGAGKTTVMRILTGFMPATAGRAIVAGHDVFESPMEVKRRVGYLPETPPVYTEMTVKEYLRFVARMKELPRAKIEAEVERVADRTSVRHVMDRLIANLSKGYRQRVGLAQALLGDPEVLILDEPTVGLDPIQINEVRELVKSLAAQQRHTIILSTHILPEVTAICQRVLMIAGGKVVADGSIPELTAQHGKSLEEVFIKLATA
ncbi:MAG: ABC transporter ATP-binding protein [Deltaproteobacteria bacterium]|jgi:ABC-2 type transport system ATP-binding protein|nr:ABC transporter ATP-binding protein [Deltaproteobacteria bacterium]